MRLNTIRKVAMAMVLSMTILTLPPHMVRGSTAYAMTDYSSSSQPRAKLQTYYLGKADTTKEITDADYGTVAFEENENKTSYKSQPPPGTNAKVGEIYWVGIGLTDFDNFSKAKNDGITAMEIAINYDPEFLRPCTQDGRVLQNDEKETDTSVYMTDKDSFTADWLNYVRKYNLNGDENAASYTKWNSSVYEMTDERCDPAAEIPAETNYTYTPNQNDTPSDTMKKMYLSVRLTDDAEADASTVPRFQGMSNNPDPDDIVYLMLVPFKVITTGPTRRYLQMSLGASTFSMEFGTTTEPSYAAWEDTTLARTYTQENLTTDQYNLLYYLTFDKDNLNVDLLGYSAVPDSIQKILLFNDENGRSEPVKEDTQTASANVINLYGETKQAADGYYYPDESKKDFSEVSPGNYVAYADIENDMDQLSVWVYKRHADNPPTITLESDGGSTKQITVKSLKKDGNDYVFSNNTGAEAANPFVEPALVKVSTGENALEQEKWGYNNKLTITLASSSTTYTIYLRRFAIPRIELEPGNSPVGLIMRDTDNFIDDDHPADDKRKYTKEYAIEAFDKSDSVNKTYGKDAVPEYGQTKYPYTTAAWNSYNNVNYDLDETALFVYLGRNIKDPGYSVYDKFNVKVYDQAKGISDAESAGNDEETIAQIPMTVTSTLTTVQNGQWADDETYNELPINLISGSHNLRREDTVTGSIVYDRVKPDRYYIEYKYKNGNDEVTAKRPLILLGRRGDVRIEIPPVINDLDGTFVRNYSGAINATSKTNSLVSFRCADVDPNAIPAIDGTDATIIISSADALQNNFDDQYYHLFE